MLYGTRAPWVEDPLCLELDWSKRYKGSLTVINGTTSEIRKGSPQARALNESGVGKIRNFQPISRHISETVQDRTKVIINH